LRYLSGGERKPSTVHIYNLNSLLRDDDLATLLGKEHLPPGAVARDTKRWKFVVGNPPYIRAERVKYGDEMKETWKEVWGQNSDTGLLFLHRSMKEWLEDGGLMGMVVSGGYANSEAAARIWRLFHPGWPGSICTLRKLVWLEFVEKDGKPEPIWDVARVPMILIVERKAAAFDDEIELYVPGVWPGKEEPTRILSKDFFDARVNPKSNLDERPFGDYLLPLLVPGDVDLMRRLKPEGKSIVNLSSALGPLSRYGKKPQSPSWTGDCRTLAGCGLGR
jgi:hypothetical protein